MDQELKKGKINMNNELEQLQQGLKPGEVRLHNKFHTTSLKCGFVKYNFHTPFAY